MNPRNPVGWFEIYVNNLPKAQKFYETVLNLKLEQLPTPDDMQGDFAMMAFPGDPYIAGSSGSLVYMKGFKAGANSTIVYFSSEDCSIEEHRVEKAGGKVFKPKMSIGQYGFISLCTDPDGNMFGIHSMK